MKKTCIILIIALMVSAVASAQQIIAQRGYHASSNTPENSLAALREAQERGLYAVECDVNMTSDGEIVVVNGPWLGNKGDDDRLNIQRSDLATIRSKRLTNGEAIPTLDEFLAEAAKHPSLRLIIEIKEHATPQQESKVVRKVVDAVREHKLQEVVEYGSMREHVCNELVRTASSEATIYILNGMLTPEYAQGMGYTGIAYNIEKLRRIPRWIKEARKLNMNVAAWGINNAEDALWAATNLVDYIITDNPDTTKKAIGQ